MAFQKEVFISLQSGNMAAVFVIFLFFSYKKIHKKREDKQKRLLKLALSELGMIIYLNFKLDILKANSLIVYLRFKKIISKVSYVVFLYIFLFIALVVFVSHTAYQLGSFGKNLAQFDTDFVVVDYNLNGKVQKVEGIRVYQDKNYIVVRDSDDTIHNIFTDQIHIQTKHIPFN
ncbi:MAG: hypothetical protein ACQEXX_18675 [Bacillota bacterium]